MTKFTKNSLVLLICVTLLLACSVSGTVAYLVDASGPVDNTFKPATQGTDIKEPDWNGTTKSTVKVENTGNVTSFVRVMLVGYWCNAEDQIVRPWDGDEFELNEMPNTNDSDVVANGKWVQHGDYYYFTAALQPGETTTNLLADPIIVQKNENGDYLVLNVLHQSIQAEPDDAVEQAWGVHVTTAQDGTKTISK